MVKHKISFVDLPASRNSGVPMGPHKAEHQCPVSGTGTPFAGEGSGMGWHTGNSMQDKPLTVKGLSRYHIKYTGTGGYVGNSGVDNIYLFRRRNEQGAGCGT